MGNLPNLVYSPSSETVCRFFDIISSFCKQPTHSVLQADSSEGRYKPFSPLSHYSFSVFLKSRGKSGYERKASPLSSVSCRTRLRLGKDGNEGALVCKTERLFLLFGRFLMYVEDVYFCWKFLNGEDLSSSWPSISTVLQLTISIFFNFLVGIMDSSAKPLRYDGPVSQ